MSAFAMLSENLAHACELDVWVEPVNSDAGVRLPTELDQLQKPLGAFESLMVGPNGLDVQSSQNLDSERVARLPPGRALRLLRHLRHPKTERCALAWHSS